MIPVRPEFDTHLLNQNGLTRCAQIARAFSDCLTSVEQVVPAGRERALVTTKLQEACAHAKRAVAQEPGSQA